MNLFMPLKYHSGREKDSARSAQRLKRVFLVNACFLLLPSYILHYYLGLHINYLYAIVGIASLMVCLHETRGRLRRGVVELVFLIMFLGSVASLISGVYSQLLMALALSLNLIIAFNGWRLFADRRTLKYLTFVALALVAGAAFALLYAYSGGAPLADINLYGRESYFYLTTFTNAVTGNVIRPAGIFDEPGALAMYVTLVVALNEAMRVNTKWSVALLLAGLVSGSFALFIIAIVYLLIKFQRKNKVLVTAVVVVLVALVAFNDRVGKISDQFFFDRLEVIDGRLAGDNRTHQMQSFLNTVDWDMTIRGQKASGKKYGEHDISSNPFSIYYGYGLIIWVPYVVLEIWLLYCTIFYRPHLRFPAFALFLTLLQRPYVYSMHWGTMIAVLVIVIYRAQRERKHVRRRNVISPIETVSMR